MFDKDVSGKIEKSVFQFTAFQIGNFIAFLISFCVSYIPTELLIYTQIVNFYISKQRYFYPIDFYLILNVKLPHFGILYLIQFYKLLSRRIYNKI